LSVSGKWYFLRFILKIVIFEPTIILLYKRAFRKGKEVTTFLIKDKMSKLAWNLRIEPRPYQREATEWALTKQQAVCSLPTSTGNTIVAVLWGI